MSALISVLAALAAFRATAQTNTLIYDPFTATAGSALNGSAPADHGGIGTDAWVAPDTGLDMNGSSITASAGSRWAAVQFAPVDGNKYRLSMDMNPTSTGDDWLAIGFCDNPNPTLDYGSQHLSGWMLARGLNPAYPYHSFTGYGTDGGGQAGNFSGPHNLAVVLDTTLDNWTFEYFVDGVSQRGPVPFSTTALNNPSIAYVTFGSYGTARGTMDNFKLENILHIETGPPTIVKAPQNATVLVGGLAKFEVVAAGPKPLSYQWYKSSQMLTNETGSELTLTNLTMADSGSAITVQVSNSYGHTNTAPATLTVLNITGPLIHKFTFNDGTANDSVGGMTGTLKGTAKIVDGQLSLDGSDGGFVQLSDYAMPPTGNASVVAWFRTSSSVGISARVFDFGSGTLNYFFFTPMTAVGGVARLGLLTGTDPQTLISTTPTLNDDLNHMVAAVIDSTPTSTGANGTMYLYLDGVLAGTMDLNGTIMLSGLDVGHQNYFGKSQWVNTGDMPYKGFIDEVRIYNTALSAQAIAALVPDTNPAAAPVIDTQPQNTTANVGGSAIFLVGVTGSQPLTYKWRLNGVEIPGSNTNVFTVNNLRTNDFGSYDVVVTNSLGSVTSLVAHLIVNHITYAPWSDDPTSGVDTNYLYTHAYNFGTITSTQINGLTFTGAPGGSPSYAGSFRLTGPGNVYNNDPNNSMPADSGSHTVANDFIYGGNPSVLTLYGLKPGKQYLLTVFSVAWDAPGIRQIRYTTPDGQNTVIDQDAYGMGNGITISLQYTADTNGSMTVTMTPLTPGNTHHLYGFANRVLNKAGATDAPDIYIEPQATSAATGGSASFSVSVLGTAPLKYQWFLNGQPISGANGSAYTDTNVQTNDFGTYSVVISNNFGSITSTVARLALLEFSYAAWTDDASSGADSRYVYTHAYNFGATNSATINGIKFTGVAGGNPVITNVFSLTGVPNVYNNSPKNMPAGSGSEALANDFIYGGNPGVLTLYGLTPGAPYLLTMYSEGWDASPGRVIQFSAAGGQSLLVDQDTYGQYNGIIITYQYTADASGSVWVSVRQAGPAGTHHMYAFSNRELDLPGTIVSLRIASGTGGNVVISWPQSATGFTLYSTSAIGTGANWQPVGTPPVLNQGQYQVTVPAASSHQFLRLQK